jgi:hypothetical protein
VNEPAIPSPKSAVAGAATIGARSAPDSTAIDVVALPQIVQAVPPQMSLQAVNVTVWVPTAVLSGHHVKVAEVSAALVVNWAPTGSPELGEKQLIGSPSGSAAVTVNVRQEPAFTVCELGAVTTGPRALSVIVMAVVALLESDWLSTAVKVTL